MQVGKTSPNYVFYQKWFESLSYHDSISEESEKEAVVSSIDPGEIHTYSKFVSEYG